MHRAHTHIHKHSHEIYFNQVIVVVAVCRIRHPLATVKMRLVYSIEYPLVISRRSKLKITHELIRRTMSTKNQIYQMDFPINGNGTTLTTIQNNDAVPMCSFHSKRHSFIQWQSSLSSASTAPFAFYGIVKRYQKWRRRRRSWTEWDRHGT